MKKAILVVGPESSGTRMMTRFLIEECGCEGDWSHHQPKFDGVDRALKQEKGKLVVVDKRKTFLCNFHYTEAKLIVFRRSFPHGKADSEQETRSWPDISEITRKMCEAGFQPIVLIMDRDWNCMSLSQTGPAQHVDTLLESMYNLREAYRIIFRDLPLDMRYIMVQYQSMKNEKYRAWLYQQLGIDEFHLRSNFVDGDEKHYE